MSSVSDLIAAIEAGPPGPSVGAFFDLGALAVVPPATEPLGPWAGRTPAELDEHAADWFRAEGAAGLRYEGWDLVNAHRRRGHLIAVVSSDRRDRIAPFAAELGIEHVVANAAEVADGVLTGRVTTPVSVATDRLAATTALAAEHDVDLAGSFAYSGRGADLPLFRAVGHAVAVAPDAALRKASRERDWPVLAPFDREAHRLDVARTVASYAGFVASAAGGLTTGLARGRRRTGADNMSRAFGAIGPLLSGIRVNVHGAEHARDHRPAVFLLNHQSSLVDAIVTFHVLRDGFAPVAKKQVKSIPVLGPLTSLAGWAYVDRVGDRSQAVAAIADAVATLDAGVSVILAPEGTRSPGPRPGPFKKGAFFMAREAGVPVVPIVIRNAGELMWRSGKALKPGTVDVAVLPPIRCDWTDDELDARVDEVRELYVETLSHWPA